VTGCFTAEILDLHLHGSALLRFIGRRLVAFSIVGFLGGGGVDGSASLLFLSELFLLLERNLGTDLVLGGRFDHAGRSLFMLRSGALLLQDRAGERRALRKRQLHGVTNEQPSILRTGHRALHENEAAVGIRAHDFQVLLGALLVAHVAGHLLVLEDLARILALAGRTVRTVTDRNTMRSTQAAEAPALHDTGKTLTLSVPGDIHHLAGHEVLGTDGSADRKQRFLAR